MVGYVLHWFSLAIEWALDVWYTLKEHRWKVA